MLWAAGAGALRAPGLGRGTPYLLEVLPVLHNLEPGQARAVLEALPSRVRACSVSLRHGQALAALGALSGASASAGRVLVGASTVCSEEQVRLAKRSGAGFISTMFYSQRVLDVARAEGVEVLGGVVDLIDAGKTLQENEGVGALKFNPASVVTPTALSDILARLTNSRLVNVEVVIAGGVTEGDVGKYLTAGATGVAVGIDCLKFKHDLAALTLRLESFYAAIDYHNAKEQNSLLASL